MYVKNVAFSIVIANSVFLAACDPSTTPSTPSAAVGPPAPASTTPMFPPGDNKFEAWDVIGTPTVRNATVSAPDGAISADAVDLKLNDGLGTLDQRPVKAGDTRKARIYLWGSAGQNVALQLVNWCSTTTPEVETSNIVLTTEPKEYVISKTFAYDHDCSRFQFILIDDTMTTINAWNARLE
jgi:hypothetical protein